MTFVPSNDKDQSFMKILSFFDVGKYEKDIPVLSVKPCVDLIGRNSLINLVTNKSYFGYKLSTLSNFGRLVMSRSKSQTNFIFL